MKKYVFISLGIILAFSLVFFGLFAIKTWVVSRAIMSGGEGMAPTLTTGDKITIYKLNRNFKNGDIIAYKSNEGETHITRIIATEGQVVNIVFEQSAVYVDGQLLYEPYIKQERMEIIGDLQYPITVPKDSYFVMEDNRNYSGGSRFSSKGFISKDRIIGKVLIDR
ncbi:MAG: signal peptidase I [Clostridiales bacterium]|jgi:signal peptidase I|nr:signal peptidase I [Clostridiales bacterium]